MSNNLTFRTTIAIFITVIWALGYLVSIITQNYQGIIPVTPVMLVAAAYLFGGSEIRSKGVGNGSTNGGTPKRTRSSSKNRQ